MIGQLEELHGVLLVDKPQAHTSHDVVARLRGKLHTRKIGHAGTLDPMATGLLIMLVGKATRISQYLISLDKEYTGTIELGKITDTQDAEGRVMETRPVPDLSEAELRKTMAGFMGDQYQTPPMYSAIKIDGVPLYKKARAGAEVVREPRFIRVSAFELTRFGLPQFDFRLHCSKGTYVRTIANDLGERVGCGGHLAALCRTASGQFKLDQALPLEAILELSRAEIKARLIPIHEAAPSVAL